MTEGKKLVPFSDFSQPVGELLLGDGSACLPAKALNLKGVG
jgi:hypothetical protein